MSYRVQIDRAVNCVFVQHYGTYEVMESSNQLRELVRHPDFVKEMNIFRDVSRCVLPGEYDRKWFINHAKNTMQEIDEPVGTHRQVAWILGNPHDFKIIHQWCVASRLNRYVDDRQPFRNHRNALRWLGIPEDYEITYPDDEKLN